MTLLTPEWSRDLRRRTSDPSFSVARKALDQRLSEYHRFLPQVPVRQAGYYHDFFCPEHAVQLIYDPRDHAPPRLPRGRRGPQRRAL